ncbi:hybrid sensor histidine kinase/response regulator transcription factor [Marinilabilia salmonicolor]|uniref:hybrid sensor histidine kinase/response regulator transcription factor n=2 Tax=Marinilabilia salmonicolor TaxID=989 RepID=UPI00029AFB5E|nr:hybrid sensor histidine kinase/response regulator transcription factor [Marinilabilia salmonicolor]
MKNLIIILVFSSSLLTGLWGQANYHFEQISLEQGLSEPMVQSILRDDKGLLWIGTIDGLNRYDGNEMITYYRDSKDPTSIPGNHIYFVKKDDNQNLWIGTSQGLARYEPRTNGFDRVELSEEQWESDYSGFLELEDKVVFGSSDHLVIYSKNDQSYKLLSFKGEVGLISLQYSILPWDEEHVLIGSIWNGLFLCHLLTGEVERLDWDLGSRIMDLTIDQAGKVWLSVYGQGLMKFNRRGELEASYKSADSGLTNDIILDICLVDSTIWIGTDGGGVNVLYPDKGEILPLSNVTHEQVFSQLNSIYEIYQDDYSNIWLGTIRGGVFGVRNTGISSFSEAPLGTNLGTTNPSVVSLVEATDGTIWVGTDGGGINAFYPDSNRFEHFPSTLSLKVNGMSTMPGGKLLLNDYGHRPRVFDIDTHKLKDFLPEKLGDFDLPGTGRLGVNMHRVDERIFIFQDSIFVYNNSDNKIRKLELEGVRPMEGELKFAGRMMENIILYGNQRIYRFNYHQEEIDLLFSAEKLSEDMIYSACMSPDGMIWIGGARGIYQVTQSGRVISNEESDVFRKVTSIIADHKNRIWFGTSGSLFSYHKELDVIQSYGPSDGVRPNQFLHKPVLRARNGDVYMGGVAGFVRIRAERLYEDLESVAEPSIVKLKQDGRLLDEKQFQSFSEQGKVFLPHNFNNLEVQLFFNDEELFNKQYYRYWLKGAMMDTIETTSMNLSFSNLEHGDYTLYVFAKTSEGLWGKAENLLEIKVKPAWWNTWWFYLLASLLFGGLLYLVRSLIYSRAMDKMQVQLIKRENQLNEQKVNFLVNISHELRTPLSLIYNPLERMLKGLCNLKEEQAQWLQNIFRNVNYIKGLIDQLMDYSRMESAENKLELSSTVFNQWLLSTVREFENVFRNVGIGFEFELDDRIGEASFDYVKLKRVIHNFLMNVLRHAPETKTVTISSQLLSNQRVRVTVGDEGPGFSADNVERIFERYYTDKENDGGTGIGLAFSKMLIQMHQGKIGAVNREKTGAELYFELPMISGGENNAVEAEKEIFRDNVQEQENQQADIVDKEALGHLTVLLVEDDRELLSFLKETLKGMFKKVLTAGNGREALDTIGTDSPDLVISDVMMPVMDGWELCRTLKSDPEISHIPVILLTARSSEADSVHGYKLGADHYLTKPVSLDLLTSVVQNLVHSRADLRKKYRENRNVVDVADVTFSNADEKFLNKLNEIIEKEIENPGLNVDLLVDRMAMSRASLYTMVKAVVGTGVNNYINEYKINFASRMLKETDLSIAEISFKLGFSSQGYFSTLFKQQTGYSPKKYRQVE